MPNPSSRSNSAAGVTLNAMVPPLLRPVLEHIVANHRPEPGLPPCTFHDDAVEVALAAMIAAGAKALERREKFCPGRDLEKDAA